MSRTTASSGAGFIPPRTLDWRLPTRKTRLCSPVWRCRGASTRLRRSATGACRRKLGMIRTWATFCAVSERCIQRMPGVATTSRRRVDGVTQYPTQGGRRRAPARLLRHGPGAAVLPRRPAEPHAGARRLERAVKVVAEKTGNARPSDGIPKNRSGRRAMPAPGAYAAGAGAPVAPGAAPPPPTGGVMPPGLAAYTSMITGGGALRRSTASGLRPRLRATARRRATVRRRAISAAAGTAGPTRGERVRGRRLGLPAPPSVAARGRGAPDNARTRSVGASPPRACRAAPPRRGVRHKHSLRAPPPYNNRARRRQRRGGRLQKMRRTSTRPPTRCAGADDLARRGRPEPHAPVGRRRAQ